MDFHDLIELANTYFQNYIHWMQQEELLGIPYGRYLLSAVILLVFFLCVAKIFRIARLNFLAKFTSKGRITKVLSNVDGDTIKVEHPDDKSKKASIRMIGVDTPESLKSLYMDIAPYGKEAAAYTKKRLKPGTKVILIYDEQPYDKFGRELVYVYLASGEFYNQTLIKKGYAFAAEYKPNLKYAERFKKQEANAKKKGKRLWAVYAEKGELRNDYKRSNAYRRFKYKYNKKPNSKE